MRHWKSKKNRLAILFATQVLLGGCATPQERAQRNAIDVRLICRHFGEPGYLRRFPDATWENQGASMIAILSKTGERFDIATDSIPDTSAISDETQLDSFIAQYRRLCSGGFPPSYNSIPYVVAAKKRTDEKAADQHRAELERQAAMREQARLDSERRLRERQEREAAEQRVSAERRGRAQEQMRIEKERRSALPIGITGDGFRDLPVPASGFVMPCRTDGQSTEIPMPEGGSDMSVDWVYTVLSLDAESYYYCHLFSLTPLGRQTFVASPEFQRLKQRLAESRAQLLTKHFRIQMGPIPDYNPQLGGFLFLPQRLPEDYDLVYTSHREPFAPATARYGIFFGGALPVIETKSTPGTRASNVLLRLQPARALEIENNRNRLTAVIDFDLNGVQPFSCTQIAFGLLSRFSPAQCNLLVAKNIKLSIRDRNTDQIVYEFNQ